MKIIIPYKESSERCYKKNIKPFYKNKSILDLTIDCFRGHDIYLASIKSNNTSNIAKKHNANTIDLPNKDEGWSDLLYGISQSIKENTKKDEPICFWLATEITFFIANSVEDLISHGTTSLDNGSDSTVLVRPFKHFLLNSKFRPDNFNPGAWHPYSQYLDQKYIVVSAGITTQQTMEKYRYTYGPNVAPFITKEPYVDIDTEEEFKMAQILWNYRSELKGGASPSTRLI